MMVRQLLMMLFLIGSIIYPENAHTFPPSPERVSAACLAQIDAILVSQFQDGVNYDPGSQSWWFEGITTERVRYDIRGDGIDLVRVRFQADGQLRSVWVAAGIQLMTGEFHSWGPWNDEQQALEGLRLGKTRVRVDIGEKQGVFVDTKGLVDFTGCESLMCRYASWSEASSNDFSQRFLTSNGAIATSWYPWGFLVWRITPQGKVDSCTQMPNPLDEIRLERLFQSLMPEEVWIK